MFCPLSSLILSDPRTDLAVTSHPYSGAPKFGYLNAMASESMGRPIAVMDDMQRERTFMRCLGIANYRLGAITFDSG